MAELGTCIQRNFNDEARLEMKDEDEDEDEDVHNPGHHILGATSLENTVRVVGRNA